ncbi:MAG: malto-oligosyltrehalose trehalohydrolase, partial [Cytophagaceae bacterium]
MISLDVTKRGIGVNFANEEAKIIVWAPYADKVELSLREKTQKICLNKADYGYWEGTSKDVTPGTHYKFLLNGEKERPDPASFSQPNGVHNYSKAIDLKDFKWTDQNWRNLPLEDYIFYELHTGTFTPEG